MFSVLTFPALAQEDAATLLERLKTAEGAQAERVANQVLNEWSKSGSASMDLLLKRGRDALDVGDLAAASDHFGALTDHAPEFAEGWHGLALVYFQQERFGLSLDALERTLTLNPNHFGALRGLGTIYEMLDRPDLAYRAFELVLSIHPHDSGVAEALERLETRARGITL